MDRHLGHVHLKVRDREQAVRFYTDVFDLQVTEEADRYAFLSFGDHHHDVAIQEVGEGAVFGEHEGGGGDENGQGDVSPENDSNGEDAAEVGLYHAGFEVPDEAELGELYRRLRDREVETTSVDHGISKALYFEDPSGNGLEAYVDTRGGDDEKWRGKNDEFDPTTL